MVEFPARQSVRPGFDDLVDKTVNEIFYSGTFRHLATRDMRSEASQLWTTDADLIPLQQTRAPHKAATLLPVRDYGTANALALSFSAELASGLSLSTTTKRNRESEPLVVPAIGLTGAQRDVRCRLRPSSLSVCECAFEGLDVFILDR